MDTIYALASGRGKAGVAVVRVSGPRAMAACEVVAQTCPPPGKASLRTLRWAGDVIDRALVLYFEEGHSFTGDETVEFQLHGSVAVVGMLLSALGQIEGLRPAEAGEFTRRALENDQLDLAQVEGLSDLIEAETAAQHRQAMRVFSGQLGALTEIWRQKLIEAAALLEVTIDFADEEVPVDVTPEVNALIAEVRADLQKQIAGHSHAERVRSGFEVAIIGKPNVGKSTLLNAMAGRDAAITSEIAGTTRDVVEVRMDLGGLPVTLVDTAGIRETEDEIEKIGVSRAKERADAADLRVLLLEHPGGEPPVSPRSGDIILSGRGDVHDEGVSGLTGQGVAELLIEIEKRLSTASDASALAIRERHAVAMRDAVTKLDEAEAALETELVAENLRSAIRSLDGLTGRIGVEDLLDRIFSSFCIGK